MNDSILSLLNGANALFLDDMFRKYATDPGSVDASWRELFESMSAGAGNGATPSPTATNGAAASAVARNGSAVAGGVAAGVAAGAAVAGMSQNDASKQAGVLRLIAQYRTRAHQLAEIDPIDLYPRGDVPELDLGLNGLSEADMDTVFHTGSLAAAERMTLREIMALLEDTYAGPLGCEYMYIVDQPEKRWIQARLEQIPSRPNGSNAERIQLLEKITAAEGLERYLHTKYVGQKRFSLEGSESVIPMVSSLIQMAGGSGAQEMVIGMAHRGRLNVLINALGKSPADLFSEFEGKFAEETKAGDVKYHMGFSSDIMTPGGPMHLALAFNPSHLEIINPVVEGSVRARQQRRGDLNRDQVMPVLIHGDAAFAGQGVVMETLNMSQCRGYGTGGTVHIIINNQIGFTTSNPLDSRSTLYCTEIAKLVQAPILHVNGDDPDAVLFATKFAHDFRAKFKKDVVIDLVSYRRHGHNEADEPSITQPVMYDKINAHPTTREIYAEKLVNEGVVTQAQVDQMVLAYRDALDEGRVVAGQVVDENKARKMVDWSPYIGTHWRAAADTRISPARVEALSAQLHNVPDSVSLHRRVSKLIDDRRKMASGETPMDWGYAETMAYAALVEDGFSVRLSGQDSGRGTFSHRHAVLHDQNSRDTYVPLRSICGEDTDRFLVINSFLSEEAVLGFEYGYSTTDPETLVIWEGQFGDFANGAQVVIDQFISSGEAKWGRLAGLTMFLPHGYEGQGPEHSSARLERYLQLCADHNMQVCVPTTPAQMFHMLRRQMIRPYRRPLIVLTPKSLLRHKLSVSPVSALSEGHFHTLIPEIEDHDPGAINRVILCAGKVYFDLVEERAKREDMTTAIIRIEQLHPFPHDELIAELKRYTNANDVVWCQEEPQNQGAWYQIRHHLNQCTEDRHSVRYEGRESSASPAVGTFKLHQEQQNGLVDRALSKQA